MNYSDATQRLTAFRGQIAAIRSEMRKVQAAIEPQEIRDYVFAAERGGLRLSDLFGDKRDLLVIHNMGRACVYCTLWADGYNGVYDHLASRAAFVVCSPDPPSTQKEFAASRGWKFRMISHEGTSFAEDMGYRANGGGWLPGISVFRREGQRILRVSDAACGPGDDFNALWHLFDLLPGGAGDWRPKFNYA